MIDFLKKYKIIIFLSVLVFILGFIKIYIKYQPKNEENVVEKIINEEENNINENQFLIKEKLGEEKWNEYKKIKTEEEFGVFWENLTEEQQIILTEEEPLEE